MLGASGSGKTTLLQCVTGIGRTAAAGDVPAVRLALASISAQPRRAGSAVIPVALAAGLIGAVAFSDTSVDHAATVPSAGLPAYARALPGARGRPGLARSASRSRT